MREYLCCKIQKSFKLKGKIGNALKILADVNRFRQSNFPSSNGIGQLNSTIDVNISEEIIYYYQKPQRKVNIVTGETSWIAAILRNIVGAVKREREI